MNILQITHQYPPNTGGVATHVAEIAERLVDRGHNVTVYSADRGGERSQKEIRNGVTVRRFSSIAPKGAYYLAPRILPAVRSADADVVHAHNYHTLVGLAAAIGVVDERFVFTAHYHGGSASSFRDRLLSIYRPIGRRVLDRADSVIAVSDWERHQLRTDFGVDARVIPNGLDVVRFESAEPLQRDRPYLLCVGRLEEYKGVQHAIRALTELPKYDLLVAGTGAYRSELERLAAELDVSDRVTFLGYVDDEALPGLYAGASVFVTLSSFEAYGMTVAEALAADTPCVVRTETALSDWADVDGVVGTANVAPGAVTNAITRARNLTVDAEIPTWDDVTTELLSVYRAT